MKKTNEILIFLLLVLTGNILQAQNTCLTSYSEVQAAFSKAENKAIEERSKILKLRFFDPIERADLFFKALQNESPELFRNTDKYKFGVLSLLSDTTLQKDQFTNFDIENLLYNLCLENYIIIIDTVYAQVKRQKIDFGVLNDLIIQDFNVSNLLLLNYQDSKVQYILNKICDGIKKGELKLPKENTNFLINLEHNYNDEWKIFILASQKKVPPILHAKKCN